MPLQFRYLQAYSSYVINRPMFVPDVSVEGPVGSLPWQRVCFLLSAISTHVVETFSTFEGSITEVIWREHNIVLGHYCTSRARWPFPWRRPWCARVMLHDGDRLPWQRATPLSRSLSVSLFLVRTEQHGWRGLV